MRSSECVGAPLSLGPPRMTLPILSHPWTHRLPAFCPQDLPGPCKPCGAAHLLSSRVMDDEVQGWGNVKHTPQIVIEIVSPIFTELEGHPPLPTVAQLWGVGVWDGWGLVFFFLVWDMAQLRGQRMGPWKLMQGHGYIRRAGHDLCGCRALGPDSSLQWGDWQEVTYRSSHTLRPRRAWAPQIKAKIRQALSGC